MFEGIKVGKKKSFLLKMSAIVSSFNQNNMGFLSVAFLKETFHRI